MTLKQVRRYFLRLTIVCLAILMPCLQQVSADTPDTINCIDSGRFCMYNALGGSCSPAASSGASTAPTPASGSPVSTLVMQKVDLSSFHPDPQAVNYFNKTSLPLLKKYIPLYVQAAQDEGAPQNWELLAGIHGPELGYGDYYQANSLGWYAGPFQEDTRQLAAYLNDPTYGPVLKTLVTPSGTAIPHSSLTDAQFIVLGRLAFKHWFAGALGSNYSELQKGPLPFSPAVDSSNPLYQIESTWNGTSSVGLTEGFNGYNTGAYSYSTGTSVWPGIATTYYLLKQWEANGGMSTINVAGSSSGSCASSTPGVSPDCTVATGDTKILCEAQQYNGVYYLWGGGHESYSTFKGSCPNPSNPPNNTPAGGSPCAVDCSGLVSMATDQAFGIDVQWDVASLEGDAANWKQINISQVQPGDVVVIGTEHVEIVDHYDSSTGTLYTFGAHAPGIQTGEVNSTLSTPWTGAYQYIGKGSS